MHARNLRGLTGPVTGTTCIGALITLLLGHSVECCAIEGPDGLLVGRLLAAGIVVLAIHPNQVKAARDRYRAAAGKNDRFDAFVLCELARTDRHRFPVLAPSRDETLALKTLVRSREDLVAARVALANQLRAQLQAFWPGAQQIFWDLDSAIALAFLWQRVIEARQRVALASSKVGRDLSLQHIARPPVIYRLCRVPEA